MIRLSNLTSTSKVLRCALRPGLSIATVLGFVAGQITNVELRAPSSFEFVSYSDLPDREEVSSDERLSSLMRYNSRIKRVREVITRHSSKSSSTSRLAALIVRESAFADVDPMLVAAVVKSESSFRAMARSGRAAHGLMQLTSITEREIVSRGLVAGQRGSLSDPVYNLRLGIQYLKALENRFDGNRLLALVAYNWGPSQLKRALDHQTHIPGECIQYASRILENHHEWSGHG